MRSKKGVRAVGIFAGLYICGLPADTPSPFGDLDLKSNLEDNALVDPKLEAEKVIAESTTVHGEEKQAEVLEHEIECPRCHDSMALCSDFDNLFYVCEECDFCLFTIKKN